MDHKKINQINYALMQPRYVQARNACFTSYATLFAGLIGLANFTLLGISYFGIGSFSPSIFGFGSLSPLIMPEALPPVYFALIAVVNSGNLIVGYALLRGTRHSAHYFYIYQMIYVVVIVTLNTRLGGVMSSLYVLMTTMFVPLSLLVLSFVEIYMGTFNRGESVRSRLPLP